jgi:hypothetical protein
MAFIAKSLDVQASNLRLGFAAYERKRCAGFGAG